MKVLADRLGLCPMRRCLKPPRCSGDAVRPVGVTTPRCLLLVSASLRFDGWESLSQVPDAFGRRGQVDNATPIVLNREKSVTLGILGTTAW